MVCLPQRNVFTSNHITFIMYKVDLDLERFKIHNLDFGPYLVSYSVWDCMKTIHAEFCFFFVLKNTVKLLSKYWTITVNADGSPLFFLGIRKSYQSSVGKYIWHSLDSSTAHWIFITIVEYIEHWHWPFFYPQSLCCEIKQRRRGIGSVLRLCQHLLDDQETCNLNADHQSMQLIIVNLERRWEAIVMQAVQWQSRLQKKLSKDSVSDICLTFFSSPSCR